MAQQELTRVVIRDFPGLQTNLDPEDIPAGAGRSQVNVRGERQGELRPRQGWVRVKFTE